MENSYDKRGRPGVINYRLSPKGQKLEGAVFAEWRRCGMVVRKSKKEEAERRRREQQRIFVEGLQRYKSKGIQILIDGSADQKNTGSCVSSGRTARFIWLIMSERRQEC